MSTRLTAAHLEAQRRLREYASRQLSGVWLGLGSWNASDVARFLDVASPLVESAQRQSIALTDAAIARALERPPLGVGYAEVSQRTRKGVGSREVYRRPFIGLWSGLAEHRPFDEQLRAAGARVAGSVAMDIQLAMRETANVIDESDSSFGGYVRVANPGACSFCAEVDGAFVSSSDVMGLHNHCGCGVEPRRDVSDLPRQTNADVAIQDHGELGPMLGDPEHDFTEL